MHNIENQFNELNEDLEEFAKLVYQSLEKVINSYQKYDLLTAKKIVEIDSTIDKNEEKIETKILEILSTNKLDKDQIRMLLSTQKIIKNMERIADQSKDLAEILLNYKKGPMKSDLSQVKYMADLVCEMVIESINAFFEQSLSIAVKVIKADEGVDQVFIEIRNLLVEKLARNRGLAEEVIDIMMIIKHLEKIGDYSTNIATYTIFLKTGKYRE